MQDILDSIDNLRQYLDSSAIGLNIVVFPGNFEWNDKVGLFLMIFLL